MYYDFTLHHDKFIICLLLFHKDIEGKCGWIKEGVGEGAKGMLLPPLFIRLCFIAHRMSSCPVYYTLLSVDRSLNVRKNIMACVTRKT